MLAMVGVLVGPPAARASFVTFESGQVRPLALSPDGARLFAVNTPDDRLEIFDVGPAGVVHRESVPVGLEPVAVAVRNAGEVWVVNHLSDSVSIVDVGAAPARVVRTLLVGDEPRDIVFAGPGASRAFITAAHRGQNRPGDPQLTTPGVGRADVWVFDAANLDSTLGGTPLTIVSLFGDTPRALATSPDGGTVYAAVFHSGNQTTTLSEGVICNGGAGAAPCVVGGTTYPGGLPAPNVNVQGTPQPEVGLIVRFNNVTNHWEDELGRDWDAGVRFSLPDLDVFAIDANAATPAETASFAHVGTVLFNMVTNPVSGKVYVSNTEARNEARFEGLGMFAGHSVRGHLHEARITVLDGANVLPRHLNKHLDYDVVPTPASDKAKSFATPTAMAVTADGQTLYVAAFGSSQLGVFSTAQVEADTFVPTASNHIAVSGGGPSGLVLDESRARLYVFTRFDDAISVIDTATAAEIAHQPVFNPEPASVQNGRPVLYDAVLTSSNGEASCSSCHIFGDFDSLAWDLGNPDDAVLNNPNPIRLFLGNKDFHPLKGPMTTQSLRGMANDGPMHWRGDRTGGNDPGGDPLAEDQAFKKFIIAFDGLLGRGSPISDDDMQRFTDFILQVTYPPNPNRPLDNQLTGAALAGHDRFFGPISDSAFNCEGCHVLDPANGHFGTDGFTTFENETQMFKIPHLRNVYQKVGMFGMPQIAFVSPGDNGNQGPQVRGFGFLHDGSVDTTFRFHRASVFNNTIADAQNLEQFMLQFDSNLAPIVGQQITLTAANGAVTGARIDLLIARAAAGECDLVVKGLHDGRRRGWLRAADGSFASDFTGETISDAALRAQATAAGEERTYTCVPPGSGFRIGLDHDDDGVPDATERDEDTDPDDPHSTPAIVGPWPTVPARSLRLADATGPPANPSRRRVSFKSATSKLDVLADRIIPPPPGSAGDPTVAGAVLSIYNAAGMTDDDVRVDLPASGWKIRAGSVPSYRYRSADHDAAVSSVIVKRDGISVRGGRAGFAYSLNEPSQRAIAVRLTLGSGARWCAEAAPSRPANDRVDRFSGDGAPPAFCPPRP
jgi:DNA-binding beta-propeller fold protein YncE